MEFIKNSERLDEIKSHFNDLKNEEREDFQNKSYDFLENGLRNSMINWLTFLCQTCSFRKQTLYRAVIIFDKYMSKIDCSLLTQELLNLITISCLSLATKLEEVNCNYVLFFTEKVLNTPECKMFDVKDLTKMELKILKKLKFKTLYSTCLDFLDVFTDLFKNVFHGDYNLINDIINETESLLFQNIANNCSFTMNQCDFTYMCFSESLSKLGVFRNSAMISQIQNTLLRIF